MEYLLTCECGRDNAVTTSQAGQQLVCECGKTNQVPTLRALQQLPKAKPAENTRATSGSVWSGWRGPCIAIATAIFLIAGFYTARFMLQRSVVDTSYNQDAEIKVAADLFDTKTPGELSMIWQDFQSNGIGERIRPAFYFMLKYADERLRMAQISGVITALAGIAAIAIWASAVAGRKK